VVVVRHQTEAVTAPAGAGNHFRQHLHEPRPVAVVAEDPLAPVPACCHMKDSACDLYTNGACHDSTVSRRGALERSSRCIVAVRYAFLDMSRGLALGPGPRTCLRVPPAAPPAGVGEYRSTLTPLHSSSRA
jgi:hypothetical protein